jgi:enoyl-CoA hydratase/carnithine racemase
MTHVAYQQAHGFGIATLNRPRANAIGVQMVHDLTEVLRRAEAHPETRALMLTGAPGMFSAGLDVPELVQLDRAGMTAFWKAFNHLLIQLYTSDLMIVSAISGHSPAGGCVLAIMTDYRIMAEGRYKIGLNEVAVGIPIPGGITEVYASLLGARQAQNLGCLGQMISPERALELGLVDALAPGDELLADAEARVAAWLACDAQAQITTKHLFRRRIAQTLKTSAADDQEAFLKIWFSEAAQTILHALVKKLSG